MNTRSEILILLLDQDSAFEPVCDVSEKDDKIIIDIEITDLDINNLSINILDGYKIEILGTKKKKSLHDAVYLRAERVFGSFKKKLELPCYIDRVKDIAYSDGILKITLVKKEV